jgi:type VI secretion system FHA domain protein
LPRRAQVFESTPSDLDDPFAADIRRPRVSPVSGRESDSGSEFDRPWTSSESLVPDEPSDEGLDPINNLKKLDVKFAEEDSAALARPVVRRRTPTLEQSVVPPKPVKAEIGPESVSPRPLIPDNWDEDPPPSNAAAQAVARPGSASPRAIPTPGGRGPRSAPGGLPTDRDVSTVHAGEEFTAEAAAANEASVAALLEAAGLSGTRLTPELARDLGHILHVATTGVIDLLQARQRIKDEFRLPATMIQQRANNPLKFSVSARNALHNMFVQRDPGFLDPVAAFDDAFEDIRHHQIAMLAGLRTVLDTLLDSFDPDRLQEEFDRQVEKGALVRVPARLRYWDLYREKIRGMVSDSEATFRKLFGQEFADAYEAQLNRLRARDRSEKS